MGFFSGLAAESYDRQYSDQELVARIITYFKPHRTRLIWVAVFLKLVESFVYIGNKPLNLK